MSMVASIFGLIGLFFSLIAIIGTVAPSLFKGKKTEEVPKRLHFLLGGGMLSLVALVAAGFFAPEGASTASTLQESTAPTVASAPSQKKLTQVEAKQAIPEHVKPMGLTEARQFAKGTLRVINEAEQSLIDGIQLGDGTGIIKHVQKPLQAELERWPTLIERQPDDQREHFAYCQDAALQLQSLSYSATRERTVESTKYLRKDEAAYHKAKQKCEQQLRATDSQIKSAVAAEDAELKKKFGGRECLTVYDVDKQTGQIVEQAKPAHCKKST
ncbi:hypothetical protein [Chromobacterium sphagni]|nr:hypothetical protein [Chromobacterium sphagni]